MLHTILALACLVGLSAAAPVDGDTFKGFLDFQAKWNKNYGKEEFDTRLGHFTDNLQKISELNRAQILAGGEPCFGVTQFADIGAEEFKNTYLNHRTPEEGAFKVEIAQMKDYGLDANTTIDWRTKGAVTAVKNQGQCGSCWAFSATATIESYAKLSGKYDLEILAPQQIVSCDKVDQACNGGWPYQGWNYIEQAGGIETEANYPYTSGGGQTAACQFDASKIAVKIAGWKQVTGGDSGLANALAAGPPSVCVYAESWQHYTGGIMKDCGQGQIDHAVQAVGMTADYWIVRNSWATTWGEQGYIRLSRTVSDICHVSEKVYYTTF